MLSCRLCGSVKLEPLLSLGTQAASEIFPKSPEDLVPQGPLNLAMCAGYSLVHLNHKFNQALLYGDTYGYRSGVNPFLQLQVLFLQPLELLGVFDFQSALVVSPPVIRSAAILNPHNTDSKSPPSAGIRSACWVFCVPAKAGRKTTLISFGPKKGVMSFRFTVLPTLHNDLKNPVSHLFFRG